ncbi:ankyrin repeat-containing protein NPR4-like isoform X3 [Papaver somniferum]|uniref:ankyrin repeat-containing protein NPR4-like isoform X3 n=1 Tax=Papaver somniferum TaxID=3469 RepID=UPI000E6FED84|nr:ankyrin repeat-containing protein NPR4-like isoform X3 [Papaver somniferum]
MPSIKQVPRFKQIYEQLYNEKMMHKQAHELVECMLTQLDKRMNTQEVDAFFEASSVLKTAIKQGTIELVEECIKTFPNVIWSRIAGQSILQMAVAERSEIIVDVVCEASEDEKSDLVSRPDKMGNTILHYAANLAPSDQLNSISGAYLQMQRELQWFKGVENMMLEKNKYKRNRSGDTAQHVFTEKHRDLMEKGEKLLKDTSGSCMVVAALIATVAFAAAFTAPGGNISDSNSTKNGTPIFLDNTSFTVFAVADATALFSSVTSVLMFLAIYTSRYAEVDFLKSLPQKLIAGLVTLFISMATILVAFGASMYIVLGERYSWAAIPIAVFSCVPMTLFASLQLPLFFEMVRFTYWNSPLQKHRYILNQQLNTKKDN